MNDYESDEDNLSKNSQTTKNSKKTKKIRVQKKNDDQSNSNSVKRPISKKKKTKKPLIRHTSSEKSSDLSTEPNAIDVSNSNLNTDQNSLIKYRGHRPKDYSDVSLDESSQLNTEDLRTEENQDFSSDLSQKIPNNMTKKDWTERQKKLVQEVKTANKTSSDSYSELLSEGQKETKSQRKKKTIKKKKNSSNLSSSKLSEASDNSEKKKKLLPNSNRPPRRRELFDNKDIGAYKNPKKFTDDEKLSSSGEFSLENTNSRNIEVGVSSSTINSDSLMTSLASDDSDDMDISQTPLPNDSEFKKLQSKALLSIKQINPPENSLSADTLSESTSQFLETTSTNDAQSTDVSQNNKSYFNEAAEAAIRDIKNANVDDTKTTSLSPESITTDFTDSKDKNDKTSSQTRSISGQHSKLKSGSNIKSTEDYLEEEEEEDIPNDTLTHSQMNPTVDGLSEINEQTEDVSSSDQFFNSGLIDDPAVCEVKEKLDELIIPEPQNQLMKRGLRIRPAKDEHSAVIGKLDLNDKNNEYQIDSELSELDVSFETDKKKFKKSVISKTPTNRIPSNVAKKKSTYNNYNPRERTLNLLGDQEMSFSQTDLDDNSTFDVSGISSIMDTSEFPMSRDVALDITQEDSVMQPKFEVKQANSDDEGSLDEKFKKNGKYLSSSSDEEDTIPAPTKRPVTPSNSFTEVVENTYTEIDSISGNSGSSKRHKDRTVTRGIITLYMLSSSSYDEDDEEEDSNEVRERGIRGGFSMNDEKTEDEIEKRNSKATKQPSVKTSDFDGNVILKLTIVEARNLPQQDSYPLHPYCTASVGDKKKWQRTKTVRSSSSPVWDQQFVFNYNINRHNQQTVRPMTPTGSRGAFLFVQVNSEDKFIGDREVASVQIDLGSFKMNQYIDQWVKLEPSGSHRSGGEIRLNIYIEPETPISLISPRPIKTVSPRAHQGPFDDDDVQKKNGVAQTPNFAFPQRPWTDSYGSDEEKTVEEEDKNEQEFLMGSLQDDDSNSINKDENTNKGKTLTFLKLDEEEEEEENLSENQEEIDLSPIQSNQPNEKGDTSLNFNYLPPPSNNENNLQEEEESDSEDLDASPPINLNKSYEEEEPSDLNSIKSGSFTQNDESETYG